MQNLIGKECNCDFDLPLHDWPVKGQPARVVIISIDMPLVEMRGYHGGKPFWINVSKIVKLWEYGSQETMANGWLESAIADLKEANDLLRSAHAVAERNGRETNWQAFRKRLQEVLVKQSKLLNGTDHLPAAICTPKTFRCKPNNGV